MLRTAALGAVALLATAALGSWSAELAGRGVVRVDDAVALAAAAGGTLVGAWYALTAAALVLARLAELGRRAPRLARGLRAAVGVAGAPVLRRAAVLGVGAGLVLAAVPASAGTEDPVPHDLRPGIGALSDLAPAPSGTPGAEPTAREADPAAEPPAPATASATASSTAPDAPPPSARPGTAEDRQPSPPATVEGVADGGAPAGGSTERPRAQASAGSSAEGPHGATAAGPQQAPAATDATVVRPGDSLWSIARAHLGEGATDAEVAAEWPRWHTTNRAVIGADPHLIHPGQALLAPDTEEQR